MIACGAAEGGSGSPVGFFQRITQAVKKLLVPLYGATDVDLITGTETSPNITQSETFTWANPDNPKQVVVAYNDSRGRNASPINISGASVSTDGGATFTRVTTASGQSPFANTVGDPVVLYNRPTSTWFTVWLDGAAAARASADTSPPLHRTRLAGPITAFTAAAATTASPAGRTTTQPLPSNADVRFLERLCSRRRASTSATPLTTDYLDQRATADTTSFIRNVQITGDKVTGAVYIAGMDEMGGGLTNRANKIYRSTDGGNTWTNTYTGPTFAGPGRGASGFFATMYSGPAYWRHMGWGQPAAFNGVVSLLYASRNTRVIPATSFA